MQSDKSDKPDMPLSPASTTQFGEPEVGHLFDRESRMWWCVAEERVAEATGYICENAPGAWWVPTLGYTLWEGASLFPTRRAAVLALCDRLVDQRDRLNKTIRQLENEIYG